MLAAHLGLRALQSLVCLVLVSLGIAVSIVVTGR